MTHFLEHMVFKGTPRRTAYDVNRDFDRIGADYNAFTSEENTVFHAAVLPEYLPQAIDILADILRPACASEDFDMEKKVIIDEIGMYEDQPIGRPTTTPSGSISPTTSSATASSARRQSITALTRDQMHAYFQRRYVAPNITVAVAGNFDWPRFVGAGGETLRRAGRAGPIGRDVRARDARLRAFRGDDQATKWRRSMCS